MMGAVASVQPHTSRDTSSPHTDHLMICRTPNPLEYPILHRKVYSVDDINPFTGRGNGDAYGPRTIQCHVMAHISPIQTFAPEA